MVTMVKLAPFAVRYAAEAMRHLRSIEPKHHSLIRSEVEDQLIFEPNLETRNRKPLKRPVDFGAEWELRFGPDNRFRVFYQIDVEKHEVHVLAIGIKEGNRLVIGGEELRL